MADFARRSGVVLLVAAWLAIFTGAYAWFSGRLDRDENPNRALSISGGEVTLERNRAGHYIAAGSINGEAVTLLLDTGATTVAVPMSLAVRLRLDLGAPVTVQTANGARRAYVTRLASVRLGPIEERDVAAVATEGLEGTGVLLGMSFLGRLDFEQRSGRLVLRQPR